MGYFLINSDILEDANISNGAKLTYLYLLYLKQNSLEIKGDKIKHALKIQKTTYHNYIRELKNNNYLQVNRINHNTYEYILKVTKVEYEND